MPNFFKCEDDCGCVLLEMTPSKKDCNAEGGLALLQANSQDAAQEKHVPVVIAENGGIRVKIGSAPHPMLPEHYIEWVYVLTSFGGIYCNLNPGDPPEVWFNVKPEEVVGVYEHCNIHGLWKAPEPVFGPDFVENNTACSMEFTAGCVDPSGN